MQNRATDEVILDFEVQRRLYKDFFTKRNKIKSNFKQ